MSKSWSIVSIQLILPLTLFFPRTLAAAETEKTRLVLSGSSTVAPLAAEIGRLFEKLHPGVQVDVQSGGSSRGIADVRRGLVDIGLVSRPLEASEQDLWAFPIAFDGIAVITHRGNPVESLPDREIVAIYRGRIRNWREVGGPDAPITVVNKAEGRSTLALFTDYFKLKPSEIEADVIIGDNAQGIKTVAGNPGAIGYVSIGAAQYDAEAGVPIKLLPLSGIAPSIDNVQRGTFPMRRPLNLVTQNEPKGWAQAFIRFARSPQARPLIEAQYFVPVSE